MLLLCDVPLENKYTHFLPGKTLGFTVKHRVSKYRKVNHLSVLNNYLKNTREFSQDENSYNRN